MYSPHYTEPRPLGSVYWSKVKRSLTVAARQPHKLRYSQNKKILIKDIPMKGFAFIEILLALLIISVGFLPIVGMQLFTLRNSEEAYQRSVATIQLASMSDRLRANHAADVRDIEVQYWNRINAQLLPKGLGNYSCNHNRCVITLEWEFRGHHSMSLRMRSE